MAEKAPFCFMWKTPKEHGENIVFWREMMTEKITLGCLFFMLFAPE